MNSYKRVRRVVALLPAAGILFSGCLARLSSELDILLSPSAYSNLLALPSSAVAPFLEFLLKTFRG